MQRIREGRRLLLRDTDVATVAACCSPGCCAPQAHRERVGEERCATVRAMVFANKSMASRGHLVEQARRWLDKASIMLP